MLSHSICLRTMCGGTDLSLLVSVLGITVMGVCLAGDPGPGGGAAAARPGGMLGELVLPNPQKPGSWTVNSVAMSNCTFVLKEQ